MSTSPSITVWPDKYVTGITTLAGPHLDRHGKPFSPVLGTQTTLDEAMQTEYPTDAHMTCYALRDEDGSYPAHPLLRKQVLSHIRKAGADVELVAVGLDWDVPGHAPLTEEILGQFYADLLRIGEEDGRLANWRAWYSTRHGARVFYQLEKPLPVDEGERYVISIIKAFKDKGLDIDQACRDWTRRFRLPNVVRDGMHTSQESYHMVEMQDCLLDITSFKKGTHKSLARVMSYERRNDYPEQEECDNRLHTTSDKGRRVATRFLTAAKKVLKNTEYYDILIENTELMPDYGKHEYLLKMFGLLIPKLIRRAYAKPEDIFALVYEALCAWDPDTYIHDPHAQAWDMIQHIYEAEIQAYNEEQEAKAEAEEESEDKLERMVKGMQQWCDHPVLAGTDKEAAVQFVKSHLFANNGKFFFPMNEYGRYTSCFISKEQIVPTIRKTYLNNIVPTRKLTQQGEEVSMSAMEIINEHSTVVQSATALPQSGEEGYIRDMDSWSPELVLPMYRRSPFLRAKFDEHVDGWLRAFFGKHYDKAAEWIGYALAFEEGPICALSVCGPASTGKKLLAIGLSECLERPFLIPSKAIGAKHAGELLKSPFLLVNEAWPAMHGYTSPSDRFKELAAGDDLHVEEKFKPVIQAVNPLRIIMTANNEDLLYAMTRGRDLTPDDKKAVGERILHFDIDDEAAKYLWDLGGPGWTARDGQRWIRGDSGQPSNFVVAQHFLWLYENRPERDKRQRLCVMGNCGEDSSEMFHMATQSDTMPMVMRAVVKILQNQKSYAKHIYIGEEGQVGVTKMSVLTVIRDVDEERVQERSLESCLHSLSDTLKPIVSEGKHYVSLDLSLILDYAARWGIACDEVAALAKKQRKK